MQNANKDYSKFSITNRRNKKLSCEYYNRDSDYIIISSHGFCSDKGGGPIKKVIDIEAGPDVFTFDFSGCGESEDEVITIEKQIEDLKDIISYVQENIKGKIIILLGTSLGGYISLKNYSKQIHSIIGFAPVSKKIESVNKYIKLKQYSKEQEKELEENGYLISNNEKGRTHKIGKAHFEQRANIDQEELKDIECPILIVHGDKDETVDIENSYSLKNLNKNVELKVVENATHIFRQNSTEKQQLIIKHIQDFLKKYKVIE